MRLILLIISLMTNASVFANASEEVSQAVPYPEAKDGAIVVVKSRWIDVSTRYFVLRKTAKGPWLKGLANHEYPRKLFRFENQKVQFHNPLKENAFDRILVLKTPSAGSVLQAMKLFATYRFRADGQALAVTANGEHYFLARNARERSQLAYFSPYYLAIGIKVGETFEDAIARFNQTNPHRQVIDPLTPIDASGLKARYLPALTVKSKAGVMELKVGSCRELF